SLAITLFDCLADPVLQVLKIVLHLFQRNVLHTVLYCLTMVPVRASQIVVGCVRPPSGPCTIISNSMPKACCSSVSVRAGGCLLRLALVETSAPPKARHSDAASGWAVTRTAMVSRPPVNHAGTSVAAGTIQVTGPGQL